VSSSAPTFLADAPVLTLRRSGRLTNNRNSNRSWLPLINELRAIDAYEPPKPKRPFLARRDKGAAGAAGNPPSAPRGSRREGLLTLIRDNPDGLTRGELIDRLGLGGG